MLSILLLLSVSETLVDWRIESTDIYQVLTRDRVAIVPDRIFILDAKSQEIKTFDREGQPLKRTAKRGEGPGEISQTNRIAFVDGKLFAISPYLIHSFDDQGKFIGKIRRPDRMGGMYKMAAGWVNAPFKYIPQNAKIIFYGDGLKNKKILTSWETGARSEKVSGTILKLQDVYSQILMKPAGRYIFLWRSDQESVIEIFDTLTQSLTTTVQLDIAKGQYQKNLMVLTEYVPKINKEKFNLPVGFPDLESFGRLILGPDEHVYWFPPGRDGYALVVNAEGKQSQALFTPSELIRIVGEEGDLFYVVHQNQQTDELGLVRLHKDEARAFMQANPLSGD